MPPKKDQYSGVSEKAIKLFAKLLFHRREYSLTELSNLLKTSKQTVLRLIPEIERGYGIEITKRKEGKQNYYSIRHLIGERQLPPLSINEITFLQMCLIFTSHLLGEEIINELDTTIDKCINFIRPEPAEVVNLDFFENISFGTIDYTPFTPTIKTLTNAIKNRYLVEIYYKKINGLQEKNYLIMPLKLFARKDTIYLFAILKNANSKENPFRLYAVHRISKITTIKEKFTYPSKLDFKKIFSSFGVITGEPFNVIARLTGKPAFYVSERILSQDQKIKWLGDDTIEISFTAQSSDEVLSWAMAFGSKIQIIEPLWLREEIKRELHKALKLY